MEATVADWITAGFTVVLAIATGVLAVATGLYVRQTKRLVTETEKSRTDAKAARELALQPELALDLTMITKMSAGARVINVGQGVARDARLALSFEPHPGTATEVDARPWQTNVILPGESHIFGPPMAEPNVVSSFATLADRYERITLRGSVRDLLDHEHTVDASVEDLPARQREGAAALHVHEEAPIRKVGRELNKTLKSIARALRHRAATSPDHDSSDV